MLSVINEKLLKPLFVAISQTFAEMRQYFNFENDSWPPYDIYQGSKLQRNMAKRATVRHLANFLMISQITHELWRCIFSQNGSCPPSWIII